MSETTPNPPTDPRDGFTPGPWEPFNDYAPGVMTPWDVIAPGPCITIARNVGEANARLIAAAPTLLADNERQARVIEAMREALKAVEQSAAWCGSDDDLMRNSDGVVVCCDIDDCKRQETLVKVRAALALAEGR